MSGTSDRVVMARALAGLFGAGATLVALTLVLPHHGDEAQLELLVPVALAYVLMALLLGAPRRFAPRTLHALLAVGTLLIGICVVYGGPAGAIYAFMYLVGGLYA